jgi:hypothetical protein
LNKLGLSSIKLVELVVPKLITLGNGSLLDISKRDCGDTVNVSLRKKVPLTFRVCCALEDLTGLGLPLIKVENCVLV